MITKHDFLAIGLAQAIGLRGHPGWGREGTRPPTPWELLEHLNNAWRALCQSDYSSEAQPQDSSETSSATQDNKTPTK